MAYADESKVIGSYKAISEHPALQLYERLFNFTYEQPHGDDPYSLQNLLATIEQISKILPELKKSGGALEDLAARIGTLLKDHRSRYEAKINMAREVAEGQKKILAETKAATIANANAVYEQKVKPLEKHISGLSELETYLHGIN